MSGTAAVVMLAGALILARDLDGDLMTGAVSLDTAPAAGVGAAATGGVILPSGGCSGSAPCSPSSSPW
jgi:hypothetical protein